MAMINAESVTEKRGCGHWPESQNESRLVVIGGEVLELPAFDFKHLTYDGDQTALKLTLSPAATTPLLCDTFGVCHGHDLPLLSLRNSQGR
eukprot:9179277-Pyramimonas_sp.AAC.1